MPGKGRILIVADNDASDLEGILKNEGFTVLAKNFPLAKVESRFAQPGRLKLLKDVFKKAYDVLVIEHNMREKPPGPRRLFDLYMLLLTNQYDVEYDDPHNSLSGATLQRHIAYARDLIDQTRVHSVSPMFTPVIVCYADDAVYEYLTCFPADHCANITEFMPFNTLSHEKSKEFVDGIKDAIQEGLKKAQEYVATEKERDKARFIGEGEAAYCRFGQKKGKGCFCGEMSPRHLIEVGLSQQDLSVNGAVSCLWRRPINKCYHVQTIDHLGAWHPLSTRRAFAEGVRWLEGILLREIEEDGQAK
jgi:hypothetical protein